MSRTRRTVRTARAGPPVLVYRNRGPGKIKYYAVPKTGNRSPNGNLEPGLRQAFGSHRRKPAQTHGHRRPPDRPRQGDEPGGICRRLLRGRKATSALDTSLQQRRLGGTALQIAAKARTKTKDLGGKVQHRAVPADP